MGRNVIMHALMSLMLQGADDPTPTAAPTPAGGGACYGSLGCFPVDGVWGGPERPVSLHPLPPAHITPTFCLHTPARPYCSVVEPTALSSRHSSTLHGSSSLVLLTHGYLESTELEWVEELVAALLVTSERVGVVTVDWSRAALPTYAQAVANIRLVGAMTGRLLLRLVEEVGVSPAAVHLVGHSLGAHLMSYAATYLHDNRGYKVGRLTGLDPAGPYFTNTPPQVRLDPSDALFVDVIHTDIPKHPWELNKLGYADAMGHIDFYPNGGSQQAGCQGSAVAHIERKETVASGVISYIGCSHQRSHQFFTESIISRCKFVGVVCESWAKYQMGACWGCKGGQCATMGFPATRLASHHHHHHHGAAQESSSDGSDSRKYSQGEMYSKNQGNYTATGLHAPPPVKVFFGTNPDAPFCGEQYRVTLVTASSPESLQDTGDVARFTITLRGHHHTLTIPAPPRATWVEAGGQTQWVGWGSGQLGRLHNLRVEFEDDQGLLHSLIWRFAPPTLYVEEFVVEALSSGIMTHFPFCGSPMQAGESYTLLPDTTCDQQEPRLPHHTDTQEHVLRIDNA